MIEIIKERFLDFNPSIRTSNIRRGEIYYVDLGIGQGSETGKIRPCIIVQNNIGNTYSPTTIVLPITHRDKNKEQPTQVVLEKHMLKGNGKVEGIVLGEQIRTIDKSRIKCFTGEALSFDAIKYIDNALRISIGLLN